MTNPLKEWLSQKPDFTQLLQVVSDDPNLISELLDIIDHDPGVLKFTCMKVIQTLSHDQPQLVYPYFSRIAPLIHHQNNFIKWGALIALPDLIEVDDKRLFSDCFDSYLEKISDPSMITAGNAVKGTSQLLRFYPESIQSILISLLNVEKNVYLSKGEISPECHHIMIGHVINQFEANYDLYPDKSEIHAFVLRNLDNPRKLVAKKARNFLSKHAF